MREATGGVNGRSRASDGASWSDLSDREVSVLSLVGGGWTSKEISARLAISHKTVENHKQRIFAKLGVRNQAHAVALAMERGMLAPDAATEWAASD